MSEKKSLQAYEWWREANEKFDYFMAGISTALAGYLGQSFRPGQLGLSPDLLELLSVLAFVGAVLASLKRLESMVHGLRLNVDILEQGELAFQFADHIDQGTSVRIRETGKEVDISRLQEAKITHEKLQKAAKETFEKIHVRALRWYRARTYFLVSGFLLLIGARIWHAYI
jgi:hypothetical protein